jgi:hypothetical protein
VSFVSFVVNPSDARPYTSSNHATPGAGREVEVKLPGRFALDPAVRGALKTAPGVAFLEEV